MIDDTTKNLIDSMSHEALCRLWRFGNSNDTIFQGDSGDYLHDRLYNHFGGFTPEISKRIGF